MSPSIAQQMGEAWIEANKTPEQRHVVETKDGRRYFVWVRFTGKTLEQYVAYRTRMQRAIFDAAGLVSNGRFDYIIWRQRKGRSQTRLASVPSEWVAAGDLFDITHATDDARPHYETREAPDPFESTALYDLMSSQLKKGR